MQRLPDHFFVGRVEKGKKERDCNAVNLGIGNQGNQVVDGGRRYIFQNIAVVLNSFSQPEAQLPGGQGGRTLQIQIVQLRPTLAANLQNILKTQRGDQGGTAAFPLQQGIGGNGRAVDEIRVGDSDLSHALIDASGWVIGCGRQLVDAQLAVL